MKFSVKITVLCSLSITCLESCTGSDKFVIDESDKDLSQNHGLFLSGFDKGMGNTKIAVDII